jgi:hypothetical protein
MVSLEFFNYIVLPVALWPWRWLSLKQKWVPGVFPGGKGGRCVRLITLPPSCAVVMKSGNLNLLEPSGPLQACNGTKSWLSTEDIDLGRPYWILHPVSCQTPEAVTTVFKCSWGWTQVASETCRVLLQLLINILPSWITLFLYILLY